MNLDRIPPQNVDAERMDDLSKYHFYNVDPQLPCHRETYGRGECPKCGDTAYLHRYDACHTPWLVYGYEYHCHRCGCFFQEKEVLVEEQKYINQIRKDNPEIMSKWSKS